MSGTTTKPNALRWVTLGATTLALFMALLDNFVVITALPSIARDIGADRSEQLWILTAYILVFGVLLVSFGKLGDQYGRKRLFLLGVMIFVVGSALSSAAPDARTLIAARALQGLGPAFIFPLTLAIISETFDARERAIAIAIWGTIAGVSIALGPLVGGFLTDFVSWRAVFWVNVPIGIIVVAATLWAVPESRDWQVSRHIDWTGNVLIGGALFALLFALTRTGVPAWDWGTTRNVVAISIAMLLGISFVANEWRLETRGQEPLVPLVLFRNPTFLAVNVAALAISSGMFAVIYLNVLYLQNALGYSAFGAGLRMLVFALGIMATSPLSAAMSERVGVRWPLTTGFILVVAGAVTLSILLDDGAGFGKYWPGLTLLGLGAGFIFPAIGTAVIGTFSPEKTGLVSGINDMFREVGGALGVAAALAIFTPSFQAKFRDGASNLSVSDDQLQLVVDNPGSVPPDLIERIEAPLRHAYAVGMIDVLFFAIPVLLLGALVSLVLARRHHMRSAAIEDAS